MATYYISTSGSDLNSGSSASPWRTLSKGAATAVAGDTVIVRNGTYVTGTVQFLNDGTSNTNRITFQAENQHLAIISSTSGCDPAFSVKGAYITIKDFKFQYDASNVMCGVYTSANCDIRAWNSVDATPGNPTTGWKGFIAEGILSTAQLRAHSIKTNQDDSIIRNCEVPSSIEALNAMNVKIHNNVVTGQDENGLSILVKGGCRSAQIYNNIVHNYVAAGYGIVLGGDSCSTCVYDTATKKEAYNCVAYNNVVIDEQSATACNIATFMAAQNCAFFNNVFVRGRTLCRSSPTNGAPSVSPTLKNNIFVGGYSGTASWAASGGFSYSGTASIDYNNFYNFSTQPAQAHAITGNPLLVNVESNWSLSAGSPCRDAGTTLTWEGFSAETIDVSLDFNGSQRTAPWDAGIYNYTIASSATSTASTAPQTVLNFAFFRLTKTP